MSEHLELSDQEVREFKISLKCPNCKKENKMSIKNLIDLFNEYSPVCNPENELEYVCYCEIDEEEIPLVETELLKIIKEKIE